jgi:hypothetical protein
MILIMPICCVLFAVEAWNNGDAKKPGEEISWVVLFYFILYPAFLLKPVLLPITMLPMWVFIIKRYGGSVN